MQGARAVQQAIVRRLPHAEVSVSIVWINMLPGDNVATASLMALTMRAPAVRHFHDPDKQAGKAIAQSLGAPGQVAWDVYLFYPPGSAWDDQPPPPLTWAHQLGTSSWADPTRYHRGDDLVAELYKTMSQLTSSSGAAE